MMQDIETLVERVIRWNDFRQDRQYSHSLCERLILEESLELCESFVRPITRLSLVESLDGVGDITFVAIGAMWKMGIQNDDIVNLFKRVEKLYSHTLETAVKRNIECDVYIKSISNKLGLTLSQTLMLKLICNAMFNSTSTMFYYINCKDIFYKVLEIICDSNDTKDVPSFKVASHVKANVIKGTNYETPGRALEDLAKEILNHE